MHEEYFWFMNHIKTLLALNKNENCLLYNQKWDLNNPNSSRQQFILLKSFLFSLGQNDSHSFVIHLIFKVAPLFHPCPLYYEKFLLISECDFIWQQCHEYWTSTLCPKLIICNGNKWKFIPTILQCIVKKVFLKKTDTYWIFFKIS